MQLCDRYSGPWSLFCENNLLMSDHGCLVERSSWRGQMLKHLTCFCFWFLPDVGSCQFFFWQCEQFIWDSRHQWRNATHWALWANHRMPLVPLLPVCAVHLREFEAIQESRIVQLNCPLLTELPEAELLWWSWSPAGSSAEGWDWICFQFPEIWHYYLLE